MNIEIANRLVNLRKNNNLSQEALAEKLGISRQAVSKWERAEASPDTDNLILLARLYGVSLDELLQTEEDIVMPDDETEETEESEENNGENQKETSGSKGEYVNLGPGGIHVKDDDGSEVHVGWKGIHVDQPDANVHIDKDGVFVDGEKYDTDQWKEYVKPEFPLVAIGFLAYIILGIVYGTWGIGLLIFLLIPLIQSIGSAIRHRNMNRFAYPVLTIIVFILLGVYKGLWHPGWVLFLTIPVYYSIVNYLHHLFHKKKLAK